MKLDTKPNGCQQFVCLCKSPEDCDPIDLTQTLVKDGYVKVVNNTGCCPVVELVCKPETCPESKACPQFYVAKETVLPGDCCVSVECNPPDGKCIFERQYLADKEGGEKAMNKYERSKILKNVSQKS